MKTLPNALRVACRSVCLWVALTLVLAVGICSSPARAADLFVRDTTADTGVEPNPDTGPMWVSPDIWVRNTPDPNYDPRPYPIGSPTWTPQPHEDPGYDDPKTGFPAYVYVRVRNRGTTASTGTERLRVYWAKASTGLGWPTQWVDYLDTTCGPSIVHGMEVTKPRKNAALASAAERQAYLDALLDIDADVLLQFTDGVQYWDKQNAIHATGGAQHGVPAFLPWHREFLNRLEVLMRESDPLLTLLYWDWTTDPRTGYGVNLFTSSFMGDSSGTVGTPLVPLRPPTLQRGVGVWGFSPNADSTILAQSLFPTVRTVIEGSPNHNSAHGYIGGPGGQMSYLSTAAADPFFFFLHGNVDRLWAKWQRNPTHPERIDPATAYGTDSTNTTITNTMNPWAGGTIAPWTSPGQHYPKAPLHASVVAPPVYDTAPLVVPVLQPGEEAIVEIPWFPPNPQDFSCFGDSRHFCLLARIETATGYPYGMTYPEVTSVNTNTKNNNNIAWKNLTIQENFDRPHLLVGEIVRNILLRPARTRLLFQVPKGAGGTSVFDNAEVRLIVPAGWASRAGTYLAEFQGVDLLGKTSRGTELRINGDGAYFDLPLDAEESFPVQVEVLLAAGTPESARQQPYLLDLYQMVIDDAEYAKEPTVGGQRFSFDLSKLTLVAAGEEWSSLDDGTIPGAGWTDAGYDDSAWNREKAPFTVSEGAGTSSTTTYYRRHFTAGDPTLYKQERLRLQVDDGAIVYVNGVEIYRRNLPAGPADAATPALTKVQGLEEQVYWDEPLAVALPLVQGDNVIAVEVHQADDGDPDVRFDLELSSNRTVDDVAPDTRVLSPVDGAHAVAGQPVEVLADALDQDGVVADFVLSVDGAEAAAGLAAPATLTLGGLAPGVHRIEARVTDDQGETATHAVRVVVDPWLPPVVVISAPAIGDTVPEGQPIHVTAEVQDAPSARVQKVELFVKEGDFIPTGFDLVASDSYSPVATATAPPYDLVIPSLPAGMHMLQVAATDESGNVGVSPHVKIFVQSSTSTDSLCARRDVGGACMAFRVPGDQDADGVDNRWDYCPDSLAESAAVAPAGWVAERTPGAGLTFEAARGTKASMLIQTPRFEDLGGCTCYQIATTLEVADEGRTTGCTSETLERWRQRIAAFEAATQATCDEAACNQSCMDQGGGLGFCRGNHCVCGL